MPPKSSSQPTASPTPTQPKPTVQSLYEASERLSTSPTEADFKLLLSAAKASNDAKAVAAQLICRYYTHFPKLENQVVTTMLNFAKSNDLAVRKNAIRDLPKLISISKVEVSASLFAALGDEDSAATVIPSIARLLSSDDEEFRTIFFELLVKQVPEAQVKMIGILRDQFEFDKSMVPQLIEVLKSALQVSVLDGLRLFSKHRALLSEEQKVALAGGVLTRLENSLATNFGEVSQSLLTDILRFTRYIGDACTTRLLGILGRVVLPRFSELPPAVLLAVLRKIADTARLADTDAVLKGVYEVFKSLPDTPQPLNVSVAEAVLWAFRRLASGHVATASRLIGTVLAFSGQPSEFAQVREDQEAHAQFVARLKVIQEVAEQFVAAETAKIAELSKLPEGTEEQRAEKFKGLGEHGKAKRTGNNCRHLARLLLGSNPLSGAPPKATSWGKATPKGEDKRQQRPRRRPNTPRKN
jgi:hypothetical protein